MQIRTEKVKLKSVDVKRIYFEAFPLKERMPFPLMVAMSKLWNTQFWSFYDNNTLCGFVYLAHSRKIVFVMFFAVERSLRSKGYGSAILREIQSRYPDKKRKETRKGIKFLLQICSKRSKQISRIALRCCG